MLKLIWYRVLVIPSWKDIWKRIMLEGPNLSKEMEWKGQRLSFLVAGSTCLQWCLDWKYSLAPESHPLKLPFKLFSISLKFNIVSGENIFPSIIPKYSPCDFVVKDIFPYVWRWVTCITFVNNNNAKGRMKRNQGEKLLIMNTCQRGSWVCEECLYVTFSIIRGKLQCPCMFHINMVPRNLWTCTLMH